MKKLILSLLTLLSISGFSQVKIGSPGVPHANAVLELDGGGSRGLLLPRIVNTDFGNLTSAVNGTMLYNNDDGFVYIRKPGGWFRVTDDSNNPGFSIPYSATSNTTPGASLFEIQNSTGSGHAIYGVGANGNGIRGKSFTGIAGYFETGSFGVAALVTSGGNVGINNPLPKALLSFDNVTGNKIDFFYTSDAARYGIGVQGNTLQLYSDIAASKTAIGYGNSTAFTEIFRVENSGITTITNPVELASGVVTSTQFKNSNNYTGAIKTIGTGFYSARMGFFTYAGSGPSSLREYMSISDDGVIYMGQNITDFSKGTGYKLRVQGKIIAEELRVQLVNTWPDYVFAKNYNLRSLESLEEYIAQNQHLPNVPAAAEVEKSGIALGEMQSKMMEKIEEMTLYIIDLKKENTRVKATVEGLQKQVDAIKKK
ncbi:MAG: hypothetical protein V4722_24955 [Bacteroidota bacterium]